MQGHSTGSGFLTTSIWLTYQKSLTINTISFLCPSVLARILKHGCYSVTISMGYPYFFTINSQYQIALRCKRMHRVHWVMRQYWDRGGAQVLGTNHGRDPTLHRRKCFLLCLRSKFEGISFVTTIFFSHRQHGRCRNYQQTNLLRHNHHDPGASIGGRSDALQRFIPCWTHFWFYECNRRSKFSPSIPKSQKARPSSTDIATLQQTASDLNLKI